MHSRGWEKRLPSQRIAVNGAHTTETTIVVSAGAKDCVQGTILLVESTGELLKVSSDPSSDTSLPVTRSYGSVATTSIASGAYLTIIGNVHEEGMAVPTPKTYAPTKVYNYTQIFRMPLSLTRTARKTRLRWDQSGPFKEAKREALSLHSIEMEKSFIFGEAIETTGTGGKPERMTKGLVNFLSTNTGGSFAVSGTIDEDSADALMEAVFRYGSTEKLCLCGSTALRAFATIAKRNGVLNMTSKDKTYGMTLMEYMSPFGTLMIKQHPLFNQHTEWRKNALIIDVPNLVYRYIDDTAFIPNRQSPGDDQVKAEFLNESGLELHFEETHAYITGITGGVAD